MGSPLALGAQFSMIFLFDMEQFPIAITKLLYQIAHGYESKAWLVMGSHLPILWAIPFFVCIIL